MGDGETMLTKAQLAAPGEGASHAPRSALDEVETPVVSTSVALASGRRYDLDAGERSDHVTVRARTGEIILRIEVTDAGPVLRFSGAELELSAARALHLSAAEVSIEAAGDLAISAGGALREHVGGDHHTRVEGDERLEAANVELQANTGGVAVRAMNRIALDGEHIGLNDDPLPQPFTWSAAADASDEFHESDDASREAGDLD